MDNVYIARQPIVDKNLELFSYELLYRDNKNNEINNDRHASASVISNVLNKFGTQTLLGEYKAFVKIDEKFLMNDLIFSIPNNFFIFSILDSVEMNEKVVERIEQLHAKNYMLSINDTILNLHAFEKYKAVLQYINYYKLDLNQQGSSDTQAIIRKIAGFGVKVIATKVNSKRIFEKAKDSGCQFFQGYFFAKPKLIGSEKYDPSHLQILRLYNLLIQDTNIDEITDAFEQNHVLTIQLLRFMNSGAFHFKNKISSIHHVLTLMGRIPLAKWLMLMIYSKSTSKEDAGLPLMLMVRSRTELMEKILKLVKKDVKSNMLGEAYFIGVLSLLNVVFNKSTEHIIEELNVSDDVKNALLKFEGLLGEIYELILEIEAFNTDYINDFCKKHSLNPTQIRDTVLQSIENVNDFEKHMNY